MSRYLSVDGGGTSTLFWVGDEEEKVLFSVSAGPSSFKSVGRETALANLRQGLELLREQGVSPDQITRGVWGLSGCDTPADLKVYEGMLQELGLSTERHRVVNDAVPAFRAAADAPGMVVIAGTGSIVVGLDSRGDVYRLGGWSYAYSDLGSGYWMGSCLLRETALWLEGCREEDPVFAGVLDRLGCTGEEALFRMAGLTGGDEIAAFARLELETETSPLCRDIRGEAAEHLAGYASGMARRLRERGEDGLTVVLSGGLFQNESFCRETTGAIGRLHIPGLTVIRNINSPCLGGLRMARCWDGEEQEGALWTSR